MKNMPSNKKKWIETGVLAAIGIVLVIVLPALNTLPADHALHVSNYTLNLLGKFLCYAIVAIGIDLIWGFTGVLSLGQGVFFALGGYCMGMYLMLGIGKQGSYASELPDFMVFLNWDHLPWYWPPFKSFAFAAAAALWVPMLVAGIFGFLAFRSRIKGVYFSIITQALTVALCLLFFRNNVGLGGNNGLTDFKTILGYDLQTDVVKRALYIITAASLVGSYLVGRLLVKSKLGKILVAIRDSEARVRFCGYSTVAYKVFIFVVAAGMAGLAGALYVPQVGIINPSELEAAKSIEMVIWVAVGGRGTLIGAPLGALAVNGAKSYLTTNFADYWLYFLGGIFFCVVMFFPDGLLGLPARFRHWGRWIKNRLHRNGESPQEITTEG